MNENNDFTNQFPKKLILYRIYFMTWNHVPSGHTFFYTISTNNYKITNLPDRYKDVPKKQGKLEEVFINENDYNDLIDFEKKCPTICRVLFKPRYSKLLDSLTFLDFSKAG